RQVLSSYNQQCKDFKQIGGLPMAKTKTEAATVRIPDLEKEFGLRGPVIRQVLRKAGLRAPETGVEGFGPRARYEWAEGSKELKQVRSILQEFVSSQDKARRTGRTKQEVELEEEDEELEQEEEDDEEDYDEEEDD